MYKHRVNIIFHYINLFWKINLELFYRITGRISPILNLYKNNKKKFQQRYYLYKICLFIFIIYLIKSFTILKYSNTLEIYDVYNSRFLLANESIILNIHNHSINYIYIDIGCFDGETIEHFIYFNSNSSFYNIITFEPDPINYQLCKQKLTQKKYRNYNIIIIPKVVWIRNEKVFYQIYRGKNSRIDQSKTKYKSNLAKLDAIDFSSWLSHLIKSDTIKLRIKISTPGVETRILRKMIIDGTFSLADEWNVEWTDRLNPRIRPARLYIQAMFDSLGFSYRHVTCLDDERKVVQMNGTYDDVLKYNTWTAINQTDAFTHYDQRPVVLDPPRTKKTRRKLKKF